MCCYHHLHHLWREVDEYHLVPLQMIHPPELSYVQWSCQETIRALINIQSWGRAPDFGNLTFYDNLCMYKTIKEMIKKVKSGKTLNRILCNCYR